MGLTLCDAAIPPADTPGVRGLDYRMLPGGAITCLSHTLVTMGMADQHAMESVRRNSCRGFRLPHRPGLGSLPKPTRRGSDEDVRMKGRSAILGKVIVDDYKFCGQNGWGRFLPRKTAGRM